MNLEIRLITKVNILKHFEEFQREMCEGNNLSKPTTAISRCHLSKNMNILQLVEYFDLTMSYGENKIDTLLDSSIFF